jgi:AcrR family transcriptional regulator
MLAMSSAAKAPKLTRREQAAATKARVVRAAIEVFTEAGYVGARMGDIASRADVAVQTVYFIFHTKGELLQACFDDAVLGPDRLPPQAQPFYADLLAAKSGRSAIAAFVRGNAAINARSASIKEVAESASHEPDAVAVVTRSERLRREGYAEVIANLAKRFGLRPELDIESATDLLLFLGSGSTYLTLHRYGWSEERYVDWLTETLAQQLLARPGRSRSL